MSKKRRPTAWMHRMKYERGCGHSGWRFSLTKQNPFGVPGRDYSVEYKVESVPLYRLGVGKDAKP